MTLIQTMAAAGTLGGLAYCFSNQPPAFPGFSRDKRTGLDAWSKEKFSEWSWKLLTALVIGNAASFVVPVFLHATSSNLIEEISASEQTPSEIQGDAKSPVGASAVGRESAWYVLFGFCTLAAYAAPRFLQEMSGHLGLKRLRNEVNKVKETADEAKKIAGGIDERVTESDETATNALAATAISELSDDERSVLKAFHKARTEKTWVFRSKEGLATDTGLGVPVVVDVLKKLIEKGLVAQRPGRGRAGYFLSGAGLALNPQ